MKKNPLYNKEKEYDNYSDENALIGDEFDLYDKVIKIHSENTTMSEDYKLAQYHIDMYNKKFPKFIREQRKLLRIINSYMTIPTNRLIKIFPRKKEKEIEEIKSALTIEFNIINDLLIGELDEVVIMTSTPSGDIIKSILKKGMRPSEIREYDDETLNGLGEKLNAKKK